MMSEQRALPNLIGRSLATRRSVTESASVRKPGHLAHATLRRGQSEMIEDAWTALSDGGALLAAAPTGIGKTAAALSAALDVQRSSNRKLTIFFLTGRQAQHRIVVETVRRINERRDEHVPKVSLVDMIGQQGMCINEISGEFPAVFSKLCASLRSTRKCIPFVRDSPGLQLRVLQDPLHVSELVEMSRRHVEDGRACPTCPWKVARSVAGRADIVLCDYNHLFHERVREVSLEAMGVSLDDIILIVDEAHNLPDRTRRGMPRTLTTTLVRDARLEVQEHREQTQQEQARQRTDLDAEQALVGDLHRLEAALERMYRDLSAWYRVHDVTLTRGEKREIEVTAVEMLQVIEGALSEEVSGGGLQLPAVVRLLLTVEVELDHDDTEEKDTAATRLAELLGLVHRFRDDAALALVFGRVGDTPRVTTHLLDPGVVSGPVFSEVHGSVLMSGTLYPPEMYSDLLALPDDRPLLANQYPSPFLADRRPVAIASQVTTLYGRRGEQNTKAIREHLLALLQETPGHVAVFLPSYNLLEDIIGDGFWPGRRLLLEERGWTKRRVDGLLRELHLARSTGERVLLGGAFGAKLAEGIDYEANLLDAVVCVGLPVAPPSVESDARKRYYGTRFGGNAYRYAVQQPALNSVLQGMGRPIRKIGDRAFVLLLEDRLLTPNYARLLPKGLEVLRCTSPDVTRRHVRRFFKRHPEGDHSSE